MYTFSCLPLSGWARCQLSYCSRALSALTPSRCGLCHRWMYTFALPVLSLSLNLYRQGTASSTWLQFVVFIFVYSCGVASMTSGEPRLAVCNGHLSDLCEEAWEASARCTELVFFSLCVDGDSSLFLLLSFLLLLPSVMGSDRRSLPCHLSCFPLAMTSRQSHLSVVSPCFVRFTIGSCYLCEVNIQSSWMVVARKAVWHLRCL